MNSTFSYRLRYSIGILFLGLALCSGQALSSLVILSNDSTISVDATAEVWNSTIDFAFIFDSDSASDSIDFVGQTANPGAFGGSRSVSATATDSGGSSVTWDANASLNVDVLNPASDHVSIDGGGFGSVSYANPLFTPNDEGLGGGSAVARMDLIFRRAQWHRQ